jgi:hypothetical protein
LRAFVYYSDYAADQLFVGQALKRGVGKGYQATEVVGEFRE